MHEVHAVPPEIHYHGPQNSWVLSYLEVICAEHGFHIMEEGPLWRLVPTKQTSNNTKKKTPAMVVDNANTVKTILERSTTTTFYCVCCGVDLGWTNGRQLCGKTTCPYEKVYEEVQYAQTEYEKKNLPKLP